MLYILSYNMSVKPKKKVTDKKLRAKHNIQTFMQKIKTKTNKVKQKKN